MSLTAQYNELYDAITSKTRDLVEKFGKEHVPHEKVLDVSRFNLEFGGMKPIYINQRIMYNKEGYHCDFNIVKENLFSLCEVLDEIDGEDIHEERNTPF